MWILILVIVALFVLLILGTMIANRFGKKSNKLAEDTQKAEVPLDCCGAHEVCDYDEMIKNPEEIIYFEDEELDRFQSITAKNYKDDEIEEFRDVLYTLKDHEIRKWLLSIQRRNIQLPAILQQEAVQLLADA